MILRLAWLCKLLKNTTIYLRSYSTYKCKNVRTMWVLYIPTFVPISILEHMCQLYLACVFLAYELLWSGNERLCKNKSIERQQRRKHEKTPQRKTQWGSKGYKNWGRGKRESVTSALKWKQVSPWKENYSIVFVILTLIFPDIELLFEHWKFV